ncbi:hypothetical protein J3R75_001091 [Oligosphaera ethanolica]|uniref:Uncharacterized protein n=1 Tax=Oligosphaera ethanolica TaxID=760260 RepID=A0AAE4AM53_9BACT|nr:hypothetical protein [Oligosphaera ethanolica]
MSDNPGPYCARLPAWSGRLSRARLPARGVGVSPTPKRRFISPPSSSPPTVPGPWSGRLARTLSRARLPAWSGRLARTLSRARLPAVEWASRPLRSDGSFPRPRHPRRPYPARGVGVSPAPCPAPVSRPWSGRLARTLSRARLPAVEWASRPLRSDGSFPRPRHPRRPYPARGVGVSPAPCPAPVSRRGVGVSPTPKRRFISPPSSSPPTVPGPWSGRLARTLSRARLPAWSGRLAHSEATVHFPALVIPADRTRPVEWASRPHPVPRPSPGRGVGVSPTPKRRFISPPSSSPPTVPGPWSGRLARTLSRARLPAWSGRLAHSEATVHFPALVIPADRTRPVEWASRPHPVPRPSPGRGVGVSPTPKRRFISPPSSSPPTVPGPWSGRLARTLSRARLPAWSGRLAHSEATVHFPALVIPADRTRPVEWASRPHPVPRPSPGRGVGVSPTPKRRFISPPSSSPPTVPGPSPVLSRARLPAVLREAFFIHRLHRLPQIFLRLVVWQSRAVLRPSPGVEWASRPHPVPRPSPGVEWASRPLRSDGSFPRPRHPRRPYPARGVGVSPAPCPAPVSRPWSGRLAHSGKTVHFPALVIPADRTRPVEWASRPHPVPRPSPGVEWASRPLRSDGSFPRPRHPRRPYPARGVGVSPAPCPAPVSRPWSGRLAHSEATVHFPALVIPADRTRPVEWASRPHPVPRVTCYIKWP